MKSIFFATLVAITAMACSAADDSTVLLPLGLFRLPGAYGSMWQTELAIRNTSSQPVQVFHAGALCSLTCPFPPFELTPGQSIGVENPINEVLLASTSGLVLMVTSRQVVAPVDVHFNFRIRDVSRSTSSWGTEVPVIRATELQSSPIELLNVPVTSGFRSTVRVYALEGSPPIGAMARVLDFQTGALLVEKRFHLDRAVGSSATYYPAYAQLDGLTGGLSADRVTIEIVPSDAGQKLWAFASITNNDTQQVTLVTPE